MNTRLPLLFALLGIPAFAAAQTLSVAAASPSTLTADAGANQQFVAVPAGALGAIGYRIASTSDGAGTDAVADLGWNTTTYTDVFYAYLDASAWVTGSSSADAGSGPHELMLTLSSPTPVGISLRLERFLGGTAGSPLPVARIDVYDDGVFEIDDLSPTSADVYVLVGPNPISIRCQLGAEVVGSGYVYSSLRVTGTPANAIASPMLAGCVGYGYGVSPRFDGNLDYWINLSPNGIAAAVFGLDTQPLYLGSQAPDPFSPLVPCLLLPRADLVVLLSSLASQTLVIPPAARPVVLYTQVVQFDGVSLATTAAYQVTEF